jgi:CheY-like chemotaxis protein
MSDMARMLVIDDDRFYLDVLREALTVEGHDVVLAQGGVEGIALYLDRQRGRRPDLVITDMRMPGIDGGEVIRTIRKFDAHARIIAVSGEANFYDTDLFKLAKDAGADAILRKLEPTERLVIEINTLLGASV